MHPTNHAHDLAGAVTEMAEGAAFNRLVHGTLMATVGLILLGFLGFADQLGLHRIFVRAGLMAYCVGWLALLRAAVVNGFIVLGIIPTITTDPQALAENLRPLLALCSVTNKSLAQVGVICLSAAAILWSIGLLRRTNLSRIPGVVGLLCGLIPAAALFAGRLPMDFHGFGGFTLLQGIWSATIAVQLIRGRIAP